MFCSMVERAAVCLGCVCVWVHKCLMVLTKDHVKYLWNHELWLIHKEMYFFDKQTGNLSYRPMDGFYRVDILAADSFCWSVTFRQISLAY